MRSGDVGARPLAVMAVWYHILPTSHIERAPSQDLRKGR